MATTKPTAVGDTVAIIALTAANPSVATVSDTDAAKLANGETLTLAATAGDSAAMAAVDGKTVQVADLQATTFSLVNLDLSGLNVNGLTATATVSADAPAPEPAPEPPPEIKAEKALTSYPSPGMGCVPIEASASDTYPGTRFEDDPIPDPANPTGPALSDDAAAKLKADWKASRQTATATPAA